MHGIGPLGTVPEDLHAPSARHVAHDPGRLADDFEAGRPTRTENPGDPLCEGAPSRDMVHSDRLPGGN
jgi:hypothetical protein